MHKKRFPKLLTTVRLVIFLFLCFLPILFPERASTQTVDRALYVTAYAGADGRRIYITKTKTEAIESWFVEADCPKKPELSIYIALMPVSSEQYIYITNDAEIADKIVCITNKHELDGNILRALKLAR